MSTKIKILDLYARIQGAMPECGIPKFIAAQIGTSASYVRTVARQRKGRGSCESEIRWRRSPLGKAVNRRKWQALKSDPERHAARKAYESRRRLARRDQARVAATEASP
jgi:hypothetical protein